MNARRRLTDRSRRVVRGGLLALLLAALLPGTASAHQLLGRYESPLPLAAYLAAAALVVGLSFAIVILRGRSDEPAAEHEVDEAEHGRLLAVPRPLRLVLRAGGIVGWAWILVQGVVGGSSADADVGSLLLWTYAWVAIPILSAFAGPVWEWIDPFGTLHDLGAAALRRVGSRSWRTNAYPRSLDRWPAVAGLLVFVWLELVYTSARGGRTLALVLLLYTLWTLLMMAQYGRTAWRRNGEVFTVWFGVLGRLAPLGRASEDASTVRLRPFGSGLLVARWRRTELVLVALGTASILYDGISQTQAWFNLVGTPSLPAQTVQFLLFMGAIVGLVLLVASVVGVRAMAAGLVPIAVGYLIAHYFTALAFDGQRIITVASDPFNRGWNLFGTATFEPNETFIPYGIVWAVELVAVVGGHVYGALMGHRAAVLDAGPVAAAAGRGTRRGADTTRGADTAAGAPRSRRAETKAAARKARRTALAAGRPPAAVATAGTRRGSGRVSDVRWRQVPLAVLMVFLTTLTLWSLGQDLVQTAAAALRSGSALG